MRNRVLMFFLFLGLLGLLTVYSLAAGRYALSVTGILSSLSGRGEAAAHMVIWQIRLPRIVAAILAGWSLGLCGTVIQCLLKNPLGSPFTLGISQAAAFGAAFAIVILGAGGAADAAAHANVAYSASAVGLLRIGNVYSVTLCAFVGALSATGVILALAKVRRMAADAIILAGVALSSLFVSGTMLIQYVATEVEIASVVFWAFGDVGRPNWREIAVMFPAAMTITAYFVWKRWDLNALDAGQDAAKGLGVDVEGIRLWGMLWTALLASLVTAFLGVIAFVGLLAPHIGRRLVGADHRFLIPHSCIIGAVLVLAADTAGRTLVVSGALPVGVLTSFLGAPLFLYLLVRGYSR